MTLSRLIVCAAFMIGLISSPSLAQSRQLAAPGEGPLDVSAADLEVFDQENRIVYSGDVNAVRGITRLRADRIEVFFEPVDGPGFGPVSRLVASGDVFYITPTEVIRGNQGTYDVNTETIAMQGDVILTQGCNVSTGQSLVANLQTGFAELNGDPNQGGGRVRSVFFPNDDNGSPEGGAAQDCPQPDIPGDGPRPFDG